MTSDKYINPFSKPELTAYESSLKYYRDLQNVTATAKQEGVVEGRALEKQDNRLKKIALAKKGLMKGYPITTIADLTSLSITVLEKIKQELEK